MSNDSAPAKRRATANSTHNSALSTLNSMGTKTAVFASVEIMSTSKPINEFMGNVYKNFVGASLLRKTLC
ncbi:hypothetical protein ACQFX9_25265 [Aliinostoc sp. HNIBRCY26]|uniref:hypothetical protein n=1 Tax=Aliinostoc sp. HNIBRCY26 TaxID=3418997 RepID=UPI003D02820C